MTPALSLAIENVYRAFSDVPRPRTMEISPLKNPDIVAKILGAPLRETPVEAVGAYAGSAILTMGDEDDYRYFLPRIIECSVKWGRHVGFDPDTIAKRLILAGWASWPTNQRVSILEFLDEAFRVSLETFICMKPDEILCGLCMLGRPAAPALDLWRRTMHWEAISCLGSFVDTHFNLAILEHEEIYCWNEVDEKQRNEVMLWLMSKGTLHQLSTASAHVKPDQAWEIEGAITILTAYLNPS